MALAAPANAETGSTSSSGSTSTSSTSTTDGLSDAPPSVDADTSVTAPDGSTDSPTAVSDDSAPTAEGQVMSPTDIFRMDSDGQDIRRLSVPAPSGVAITPDNGYAY